MVETLVTQRSFDGWSKADYFDSVILLIKSLYSFQGDDEKYDEQLDMLFKVCHTSNFQTSVQVRSILSLHAADLDLAHESLFCSISANDTSTNNSIQWSKA